MGLSDSPLYVPIKPELISVFSKLVIVSSSAIADRLYLSVIGFIFETILENSAFIRFISFCPISPSLTPASSMPLKANLIFSCDSFMAIA
jgi:hypothetical protein